MTRWVGLLLVALFGCGTTSVDPADWYGTEQVDLQRYRRIVVTPVRIPSNLEMEPNRAAYVGSLIQQALLREIEQGGRIAPAHVMGPYVDQSLVLATAITQARHTRERVLRTDEEDQTARWEHLDSVYIDLAWSVLDGQTRKVVAKGSQSMGGITWGPLNHGRHRWPPVADSFANGICQPLGIGPVPVKRTKWRVEVLAIERAHAVRFAQQLRLDDEVGLEAMRRSLEEWGMPGSPILLPSWQSLSDRERTLLAAEIRVRRAFTRMSAAFEDPDGTDSLEVFSQVLLADPTRREWIHFLSAEVRGEPWATTDDPASLTQKRIGPHQIGYSLVLRVERAIEQGDDLFVEGGIILDDRAELLAILVVRKLPSPERAAKPR